MNEMEKRNKRISFVMAIISLVVIIGVGFAFFSGALSNSNNEKYSLETATISLNFSDNDNNINATLNLGESVTKKFTLENIGNKDAYAKINWVDLVNTYNDESLSYTLEQSTSENGTYTEIERNNVPVSSSSSTKLLKNDILIPVNTKYYYKLTITLNNLDTEQNSDINAVFNTRFRLEEGEEILPATQFLLNKVRGANQNSTEEIIINEENDGYYLEFNGFLLENESHYDVLGYCQEDLSRLMNSLGTNASGSCILNNNTGKYNFYVTGDSSQSSTYIFETESDCQNTSSYYTNTTCKKGKVNFGNNCTYSFAYDGTSDNNLRYVGADPCNNIMVYDSSNTYLEARIIGVFNNVDNGTGKKETRLKIIFSRNTGLMGSWGDETNKFETSNIIINDSTSLNAKWYIRGLPSNIQTVIPSTIYDIEKTSGAVYPGNSTTWIGTYGLMSISDYAQAVGGDNRENCLTKNLVNNNGNNSDYQSYDCSTQNYLARSNYGPTNWTMNTTSDDNTKAFKIGRYESLNADNVQNRYNTYYTMYLPANIKFSSGYGSSLMAYQTTINESLPLDKFIVIG